MNIQKITLPMVQITIKMKNKDLSSTFKPSYGPVKTNKIEKAEITPYDLPVAVEVIQKVPLQLQQQFLLDVTGDNLCEEYGD